MLRKQPRLRHHPHTAAAQPLGGHAILPPQDVSLLLLFSAVLFLLRAVYLNYFTPYGLGPDEAQYWSWLAHPEWSYVTKPPLTTWLMGLGTSLLGHTMLGVRIFALCGQAAVGIFAFLITARLAPSRHARPTAWLAFALVTTCPLVAAGGQIMSPDAILLPLWLAAICVLVRYALPPKTTALSWAPWLAIGLLIGLAGLAKYTAAFFFPLLGLYLLLWQPGLLKRPQVYAAIALALACQAPVIYWNATHSWVGLTHLLWQANPGDARHGGLSTLLEFLAGQAAVIGLVAFPLLLAAWAGCLQQALKRRLPAGLGLMLCFTLPIFLVFLAQTFTAKVQLNWPLLATVPGLIFLAVALAHLWPGLNLNKRKILSGALLAGLVLNTVLSLALYNTHILRAIGIPLSLKADPTKDFMGWPELGQITGSYLAGLDASTVLLATRYQTAAELAFHTIIPGTPEAARHASSRVSVLYLNPQGANRATQYDEWPWPDLTGRLVLYVSENDTLPPAVSARFSQCSKRGRAAVVQHGLNVRRASYYLCWNIPKT